MSDKAYLDWPFFEPQHRKLVHDLEAWAVRNLAALDVHQVDDPLRDGVNSVHQVDDPLRDGVNSVHQVDEACRKLVRALGEGGWTRYSVGGQAYGGLHEAIDTCAVCLIRETLAEAGGGPEHLVRLTWFITSKKVYLASLDALGAAYRVVMGRNFPAMSVVEVSSLMENQAKVEIEATAVIPD